MQTWTEEDLRGLRERVGATMSEKRYRHTLAVEQMVARLAALYAPEQTDVLRAAGLLHDITKEFSTEKQLKILKEYGIIINYSDVLSPKTLHARTAALLIPTLYPEFARPDVISAVRWHTTGHRGMTLGEQLLYLADYIDDSRTFPDCVQLREKFWEAKPENMDDHARKEHLRLVLLDSCDRTIQALLSEGALISPETVGTRNELLEKGHTGA